MPHFRRKAVIEARRVPVYDEVSTDVLDTKSNVVGYVKECIAIAEWCGGTSHMLHSEGDAGHVHIAVPVHTATGQWTVNALPGEWIVKHGDTYGVMADGVFTELYEEIPLPPPTGTDWVAKSVVA
jgi:L-alanine-DL-glutamate epimerase-like enolase superfamily enzyme